MPLEGKSQTPILLYISVALSLCAGRALWAAEHPERLTPDDLFPSNGAPAGRWEIDYMPGDDGLTHHAQLDVQAGDEGLVATGQGYRVSFSVQPREHYLVLRIKEVTEPVPGSLSKLSFRLNPGSPCSLVPLDYMTKRTHGDQGMSWPWIWARAPEEQAGSRSQESVQRSNPLGAFAIHAPPTDDAFDENLLRMWVYDGLPHPKVAGEWTLEKARTWLAEWQERFSDQSCLVIGAKNRDELDTMTDWAEKIGMKRIYLHTDTWRGEYWPRQYSYLRVNPEVFPRGERDLSDYTSALREKGMSFAVHSTCISIAANDPDYVRNGLHPDLSRWVRGTLEKEAGPRDKTLYFRPKPGSRYPGMAPRVWRGLDARPRSMSLNFFLVGNELVQAGQVENTDEDVWVLKHCRRGDWGTQAVAHSAGTVFEGIIRGYGQVFVPDADAALFEETIRRWAGFCSRNNVDHLECDALEIHTDWPWGPDKFSWLLASNLERPSTSNTSNGRPLPFHVEYWFRSSREVLANHARAGVAGGASLPLYLHTDIRAATGPYEILFKPAQMVAGGGQSFFISYPWPMFGVTPEILAHHGMVPVVEKLISDWRTVLDTITPGQREEMARAFGPSRGVAGRGNQRATDVLFRPEIVGGRHSIIPLRMVERADGELNWGFGQEFGPIVPRQYVRAGECLRLNNAMQAQEPECVIRVMGTWAESPDVEEEAKHPVGRDDAILASYATGTTTDHAVHPLHTAYHIWPTDAMDEGEARPGRVELRRVFEVADLAAVKQAHLYLHVDDEAIAYVNGQKVFDGGRYDQVFLVDISNLRQGKNHLLVKTTNMGGPGCATAALHIEEGDTTRVLASDSSWNGRVEGGTWGSVTELAVYGEGIWSREEPQLAVLRLDLMPGPTPIEPAAGHEVNREADALHMACRNNGSEPAVHIEDRPSWATSLDMSAAQGLGCTVTGDGSGAVLVVTIEGSGQRDYVIPIDFTGTRAIEIPSGEIAWGHPRWGWRSSCARIDYSRIRKVRVGFGRVPAETHAKVTISNLRPLRNIPCGLQDFTISLGADRELAVPGLVPSGHYLWYRGGETIGLYDLNWNKIKNLPVQKRNFTFPAGVFTVELRDAQPDRHPWLEVQFFTRGNPITGRMARPGVVDASASGLD